MEKTISFELRKVSDLHEREHDPHLHDDVQMDLLRGSIREFGFLAPVLIDAEGWVVDGAARLRAAIAEGMTEIPCVREDHLTEAQCRAYRLKANRLAELAAWDKDLLASELAELESLGFDIEGLGFAPEDLCIPDSTDVEEDDFTIDLPRVPRAKRGEVYRLGRHQLMCGDATSPEDVAALMSGQRADLLLTDPPYNVNYTGATEDALKIMNDDFSSQEDFTGFLTAAFSCGKDALAPGSSFYIWHADSLPGLAFRQSCAAAGLKVRQCLIWVKQHGSLGRQDYQWQHEPCLHGQTDPDTAILDEGQRHDQDHLACLYGWKDGRAHLWTSDRRQTTVLYFDRPLRNAEHPTMKPVRLFAYQICNSTRPSAVVLDLFAGSGSTMIACEKTGRTARLMELDPRYVDVMIARWEALTGEKAERIAVDAQTKTADGCAESQGKSALQQG
ncbi:MAG: site-specific DNA-methyltransferase [Oscillospiraceae bacterium]|nr:site-specific DNA-methyltransferase [Oscillospiraceae bacterium]